MDTTTRVQNRYDQRLRELVRSTQDIRRNIRHGVPPSTARGWLKAPVAAVVTIEVLHTGTIRRQQEVLRLRARIERLTAIANTLELPTGSRRRNKRHK